MDLESQIFQQEQEELRSQSLANWADRQHESWMSSFGDIDDEEEDWDDEEEEDDDYEDDDWE